jgi:protein disulfide-isomerase
LIGPAAAQEVGVRWQHDVETAKATARQTGRLVLVHVWADNCAPCVSLEQNVFNQPGVAGALEAKFVPVKLNANEFPATAQGFGITRVPTDVILSPDGQVLGKMISPATPSAYLAEVNQVANQYASQSGLAYQTAAAAAPQPKILNPAYASLQIGAPAQPPVVNQPIVPVPSTAAGSPYAAAAAEANNRYAMAGMPQAGMTAGVNPSAVVQYPAQSPGAATVANGSQFPASNPPAMTPPSGAMQYGAIDQYAPSAVTTPPAAVTNQYVTAPQSAASTTPTAPSVAGSSASAPTGAIPSASEEQPLPANAPPKGFEGYCPVTMRNNWQWVKGDPKWGAIHRGRTYLFTGPREQQQFLANPDYYSPALAGIDPVLAIDHRQSVPGLREHSLDYDNQFYFFSSEATLQQFTASPQRYADGVRQAMGLAPTGSQVR